MRRKILASPCRNETESQKHMLPKWKSNGHRMYRFHVYNFLVQDIKKTSYKCCITYHLLPVSCYISILTTAIKIPATLECSLPILPNVFGHLFGPRNTSIGDGCVSIFEKQKGLGPQFFFYIIHIYIYIYLYIQYLSTYIIIYIIQMYTYIYILQYNVFKTTKNNSPNHHR